MDREQLEKIRSKLGTNKMSEEDKKRLFQDFVRAGGQVLDVEEKKEKEKKLRSRPTAVQKTHRPSSSLRQKQASVKQAVQKAKPLEAKKSPVARWVEKTGAALSCFFGGILKWNRMQYQRSFYRLLVEETQNALLEIRMVLASLLHQSEKITSAIKEQLNRGRQNIDYELIYRLDSLYRETFFQKLEDAHGDLLEVNQTKQEMKNFFKQLFVLKAQVFQLKSAVEKAILMENKLRRLPKNAAFENIRKVNSRVEFLFGRLHSALMILMDYFYKSDDFKGSFSEYLEMGKEDEIGYYTLKWKEMEEAEEQKRRLAEDRKQQEQSVSEGKGDLNEKQESSVAQGLKIFRELLDFNALLQEYRSKKDPRALFGIKDKVFLTYAMLELFEREYSFIFTSGRVVFNVVFQSGGKLDVKKELSEYYFKINDVYERINEYLKILRDIYKVEQDHYAGMAEKAARLNQLSIHRSRISRQIRKNVSTLFENFSQTLLFVLSDYEGDKAILRNAEELLEFETQLEKERYVNGKKIIAVVEEAYRICYTIHFLLEEGDLGGFSVLLEKPKDLKDFLKNIES